MVLVLAACAQPAPQSVAEAPAIETPPPAASLTRIACKADRNLSCSGAGCESGQDDFLQVELTYDPSTARGSLCTFTYCREIAVMTPPGSRDATSGLVLSAASGSTPPASEEPTLDYALTIAPDLKTFALMSFAEGRFSGYGGACTTAE
jgi:hypothetical protein